MIKLARASLYEHDKNACSYLQIALFINLIDTIEHILNLYISNQGQLKLGLHARYLVYIYIKYRACKSNLSWPRSETHITCPKIRKTLTWGTIEREATKFPRRYANCLWKNHISVKNAR